jgi:hypothetical protein
MFVAARLVEIGPGNTESLIGPVYQGNCSLTDGLSMQEMYYYTYRLTYLTTVCFSPLLIQSIYVCFVLSIFLQGREYIYVSNIE